MIDQRKTTYYQKTLKVQVMMLLSGGFGLNDLIQSK